MTLSARLSKTWDRWFAAGDRRILLAVAVVGVGAEVLIGVRFGLSSPLPAYLYFGAVGTLLSFVDITTQRIPNRILLPSYLTVTLLLTVASADTTHWYALERGVLSAIALAVFNLTLSFIRGGIGMGDVKLSILLGLLLG